MRVFETFSQKWNSSEKWISVQKNFSNRENWISIRICMFRSLVNAVHIKVWLHKNGSVLFSSLVHA